MSERQLEIFQKFGFLFEGTRAFGRKIADILPILTQKTTDPFDPFDYAQGRLRSGQVSRINNDS